jgi:hypothetical protein
MHVDRHCFDANPDPDADGHRFDASPYPDSHQNGNSDSNLIYIIGLFNVACSNICKGAEDNKFKKRNLLP